MTLTGCQEPITVDKKGKIKEKRKVFILLKNYYRVLKFYRLY